MLKKVVLGALFISSFSMGHLVYWAYSAEENARSKQVNAILSETETNSKKPQTETSTKTEATNSDVVTNEDVTKIGSLNETISTAQTKIGELEDDMNTAIENWGSTIAISKQISDQKNIIKEAKKEKTVIEHKIQKEQTNYKNLANSQEATTIDIAEKQAEVTALREAYKTADSEKKDGLAEQIVQLDTEIASLKTTEEKIKTKLEGIKTIGWEAFNTASKKLSQDFKENNYTTALEDYTNAKANEEYLKKRIETIQDSKSGDSFKEGELKELNEELDTVRKQLYWTDSQGNANESWSGWVVSQNLDSAASDAWKTSSLASDKETATNNANTKASTMANKDALKDSWENILESNFMVSVKDFTVWKATNKWDTIKNANFYLATIIQKLMVMIGTLSMLIIVIWAWYMIMYHGQDEFLSKWKSIVKAWIFALIISLSSYLLVAFIRWTIYAVQ